MAAAQSDVIIGGYHIPAGTEIVIPLYVIHRDDGEVDGNSRGWGMKTEEFKPNRFQQASVESMLLDFGRSCRFTQIFWLLSSPVIQGKMSDWCA